VSRENKIGLTIVAALGGWGICKEESPPIVINTAASSRYPARL